MGPMFDGSNAGLPKDHWIHKALAKETGRLAKKKKVQTAQSLPAEKELGAGLGGKPQTGAGMGGARTSDKPQAKPSAPPLQWGNEHSV